jgi:histidinol-phosphatase (PHP family)
VRGPGYAARGTVGAGFDTGTHRASDEEVLPADGHVHSQFSWDARKVGSMTATCARAVEIGLPSVAFTEHVDFTPFRAGFLVDQHPDLVTDGILHAPPLDVDGYLAAIEECRDRFPDLTVLTGMEVGQPHLHRDEVADLLRRGRFDRVVGSLHCLPDGDSSAEPWLLFEHRDAAEVFHEYLAEIPRMVAGSDAFATFAHIDYPVRSWPGEFDPREFEEGLRNALRSLAAGGRALELNTRLPLHRTILGWWPEEGGRLLTFGSDAHVPEAVGTGFAAAADVAGAAGFVPAARIEDPWVLG